MKSAVVATAASWARSPSMTSWARLWSLLKKTCKHQRSIPELGASRAGRSPRAVPRERRPQLRGSASPGCIFAVPFAPLGLQCPMCNQEVMPRAGLH